MRGLAQQAEEERRALAQVEKLPERRLREADGAAAALREVAAQEAELEGKALELEAAE